MKAHKIIILISLFFLNTLFVNAKNVRSVNADYNVTKCNLSSTYFKCVGAGRAAEGLRADWQKQLAFIQATAPFEYIRFHGLLHDDMGVCKVDSVNGERKMILNFQYIDALYDFLLSVKIRPFVELSFMPSDMRSNDKTVFWWKGNVSPPLKDEEWGYLISELTKHFTRRYGKEEVEKWYFEVWNEPNHPAFFSAKQKDYFKMYTTAVKAIKAVDSKYRVGGPATAGCGWIKSFLQYCAETQSPVDFVSTHTYGVSGALDEFGVKQLKLVSDPNTVSKGVKWVRKTMNENGGKDMELHFTEWNSSYSPKDHTHDTYLNAAYILNTLRFSDEASQSMSYWTFTDIFEESGTPMRQFHGGFGLLTVDGLKKPSYFSYSYLSQLGKTELKSSDSQSWVCKDNKGGVQALIYDMTMPKFEKHDYNNKLFTKERIPEDKGNVSLKVDNMPKGSYRLEVYQTGYKRNDIQTAYFNMGSPEQLYKNQFETLQLMSNDAPVKIEIVSVDDKGEFDLKLPIRDNDIYLIKLTPTI